MPSRVEKVKTEKNFIKNDCIIFLLKMPTATAIVPTRSIIKRHTISIVYETITGHFYWAPLI